MARLADRLRGLAHPRSRRSQLWAGIYCGVTGATPDADESAPSRSAD